MTLREQIRQEIQKLEALPAVHFRGYDWCALSDEDEMAFGIDRKLFPRLVVVWQTYQAFCGIIAAGDAGLSESTVEEERLKYPQFYAGTSISEESFRALAKLWCDVPEDQAIGMYRKLEKWVDIEMALDDEDEEGL